MGVAVAGTSGVEFGSGVATGSVGDVGIGPVDIGGVDAVGLGEPTAFTGSGAGVSEAVLGTGGLGSVAGIGDVGSVGFSPLAGVGGFDSSPLTDGGDGVGFGGCGAALSGVEFAGSGLLLIPGELGGGVGTPPGFIGSFGLVGSVGVSAI